MVELMSLQFFPFVFEYKTDYIKQLNIPQKLETYIFFVNWAETVNVEIMLEFDVWRSV